MPLLRRFLLLLRFRDADIFSRHYVSLFAITLFSLMLCWMFYFHYFYRHAAAEMLIFRHAAVACHALPRHD